MSKRSLEELKQLAAKYSTEELKKLVESDADLAEQVRFTMPRGQVRPDDVTRVAAGKTCCSYGQNPTTGEWICLKWGPPC